MKNLFIATSDVHLNLKNLVVSFEALRQALGEARKEKLPLVIAGDLNDTKAIMRSEWVQALIVTFTEFKDVEVHIIDGNHDLNNKSSSMSSLAFLELLENVHVYHAISHITFNGVEFGLIPYQSKNEDFLHCLEQMKVREIKNLICHQGFLGAFMGDYAVDESSVDPKELKDFDWVGSGHYHKHQFVEDNIIYFGSPFTVNFGEASHSKYIWKVYEVDGKIHNQPIPTTTRRHIQFTVEPGYEACEAPKEYLEAREFDLIKIIMKGPKEFALSRPTFKHPNITLVPEIVRQSENRISQEIVSEPVKVIKSYLENAVTVLDKAELEEFLWPIINDTLNKNSNKVSKSNKVYRVRAENFLSYKELEYDYISKGLTLIEGHDEDYDISTGAGKSSFLDVVCYGLFGETSKKLKADEVINRQEGKNLFVQVEIETEKGTLLVTRYRKHKEYDNDLSFTYAGQGEATRGKDLRETQKLLEEELGLNFDMFLRSSYFTQFGNIDRFLSASDTEKKKIISEICDTQIYDFMLEDLKAALKDFLFEQSELEKKIIAKDSEYDTVRGSAAELEDKIKVWDDGQLELVQHLEMKSNDWENNHRKEFDSLIILRDRFESDRKDRLERAKKDHADWEAAEKKAIETIKEVIKDREEKIAYYTKESTIPEKPGYDTERAEINNKLQIAAKLEEELQKLNNQIVSKQVSIDSHKSDIKLAQSKENEVTCLSCYQPISKDAIDRQVRSLIDSMNLITADQVALQNKYNQVKDSLKIKPELESRLSVLDKLEADYNAKVQGANNYKKMADDLTRDLANRKEELITRQSNPNNFIIQSIENDTNQYVDQVEHKKLEKNPFVDRIFEEQKKENPYTKLFQEACDKISVLGEDKIQLSSENNEIQKKIDYTNFWKDAFHIYIKSYLTDSFIEQINQLANEKLSEMFDGILSLHISAQSESRKAVKEKISVVIYNKNEECSYNSLSGGERCRICFALNLAIAKVTDINFGFLMFDEILNGLDDVGKTQVMKVLKELEANYETIFVIDHTTEFKALFTNNILIKKRNGISEVQ